MNIDEQWFYKKAGDLVVGDILIRGISRHEVTAIMGSPRNGMTTITLESEYGNSWPEWLNVTDRLEVAP